MNKYQPEETWRARLYRLGIKADFKLSDDFMDFGVPFAGNQSIKQYQRKSRLGRAVEQIWFTFTSLLLLFGVLVFAGGAYAIGLAMADGVSIKEVLLLLFALAMVPFCVHLFLIHSGFVRWSLKRKNSKTR